MGKVRKKVKRPHVNWYDVLLDIGDLRLSEQFWVFKFKHLSWSNNRCAWNVLKSNYSTTALRRYRFLGGIL